MTHAAWIIIIGSLVAGSCGFIGSFLILRKMAMLGDAISHAILPGVVLAFMLSHSMETLFVMIGATFFGVLCTFLTQTLNQAGVQSDAAIGVIFTSLFAFGVVLVSFFTGDIHLDLQHVLYGEIAYAPWDLVTFLGLTMPKAVWMMGTVALITLLLTLLFYKELKLTSFDAQMAAAMGIPVVFIHYLLMVLVSLNTVAAFESVGAILVVAMIVVPGATAYLYTDRLSIMLVLSIVVGILSSILGYWLAAAFDVSISGSISTVAGLLFLISILFSPRYGIVTKKFIQFNLKKKHSTLN